MRGIIKSFGAVEVLRGANLHLMPSEVLGLVGDNAAGKSTLMKVLTGVHRADSGDIFFEDQKNIFNSPKLKWLFKILNKASLAISVVGRTGKFLGACKRLPLYFPEIILMSEIK